jgi:3-hydroxyacyl-CoA dehydrogenase/enoyl-CoA hydratase/3-hydroxybutyryl-CoA epimerase
VLFQSPNLRLERDSSSFATLWLDVQGQRFNVLTPAVLDELDEAFSALDKAPGLVGLLIRSAKPSGFLAGADIHEFAGIQTADQAKALSARGQQVFAHLEQIGDRIPTGALIEGPCLGGGLELALACTCRLAVARPDSQFGLPEVELGLLPAWGGTQRLPRTIGLENALQVIVGGRRLKAREAFACGLADGFLPPEVTTSGLDSPELLLAGRSPRGGRRPRAPAKRTWRQRILESTAFGRWLILRGTERILRRRVPDDMPAPFEALEAVRVGLKQGMEAGLAREREGAGRLATSMASRNLVGLFLQREAARKVPEELRSQAGQPIRRVGVVGAGTMGAGIAQLAALKGCDVVVQEVNESALGAGLLKIAVLFQKAVERGLLSQEESQKRLSAIRGTTKWNGFEDVELVVEAALEDLDAKRGIFRELENRVPFAAILATNTSSLSVARIQEGLTHPERVAGLHFFNPVHKMPLVEVIHATRTDPRTPPALVQWAVALGKTPVLVRDSPGFVVNRVLLPYLSEAVVLATQRVAPARIDRAMRRFGMPMGPLELLDQIGLDVATHVAESIADKQHAAHADLVRALFEQMRSKGWLGQKSGAGFYRYRGRSKRLNVPALKMLYRQQGPGPRRAVPPQPGEVRDRLVLPMVNAAAACLGEGVAADAETIDLAMVLGTGWAPHRGGPLHYADTRGPAEIVRILDGFARHLGPWFEPCDELRRRADGGSRFVSAALASGRGS